MMNIEQFAEQHFGIKLTKYQLELIEAVAANPDENFILQRPTARSAGKTTAMRVARAWLENGLKPVPTGSVMQRAIKWATGSDTGISSEALCSYMTTGTVDRPRWNAPSDAADRGRCIRLLQLIPEWVDRLDEMKALDVGTVSINGADPIPVSEDSHSWTYQIPLIRKEGNF